jgi:hypothetical protein
MPDSLTELARDDDHWLATTMSQSKVSAPVSIHVKR